MTRAYENGEEKGKKEAAKKMLEEGFDIQKICKITGLTEDEVKNL